MNAGVLEQAEQLQRSSEARQSSSFQSRAAIGDTYLLLRSIGAGGMGDVYAAEHLRTGREFAIKFMRQGASEKIAARFRREVAALARVESEYVVRVVDSGETHLGAPYIVMELLRGEDLRQLIERAAPLAIPRAVDLIRDACFGVGAVHRAGLIHRDLKPGNLFVTRHDSGEDWCKVLDFGVAKGEASSSTAEGALVGTVKYMAPEQLRDGASVGPAVDIYALGAILYECLCGFPPYTGCNVQELMFKILHEEPAHLLSRGEGIPASLAAAVHRALSKHASKRFASPGDLPAHSAHSGRGTLAVMDPATKQRSRTEARYLVSVAKS